MVGWQFCSKLVVKNLEFLFILQAFSAPCVMRERQESLESASMWLVHEMYGGCFGVLSLTSVL